MVVELVVAAVEFVQAHHVGLQAGLTAVRLLGEIVRGVRRAVRRRGGTRRRASLEAPAAPQ